MIDVLVIALLIGFNAFFSLAEVALISARKTKLGAERDRGNKVAGLTLDLMADTNKFLSTAQIGITIVSILTGIYSGAAWGEGLAEWLTEMGMARVSAEWTAHAVLLFGATFLQCLLGELFPKRMGIDFADTLAKVCTPPMLFFAWLCKPVVWLMTLCLNGLIRLFRLPPHDNKITEDEIKAVIRQGSDAGEVEEVEQNIMERALVMSDQRVGQLMTYRTDVVTLDVNMNREDVKRVLSETPYTSYPVIDGSMDAVCGYVWLKDLIVMLDKEDFDLRKKLQKPVYFHENVTVYKAFEHLRRSHTQFAFVCNEFGALQGILTYADIFEGLVGTLPHAEETPDIIERSDGTSWVVSGQCQFYDFLQFFDCEDLYQGQYNTLAGLLLVLFDHIPTVGERCEWEKFAFRVVGMDGNRIDKVVCNLRETQDAGKEDER